MALEDVVCQMSNSVIRSLAINSIWPILARLASAGSGLLLVMFLARHLSAEDVGHYFACLSLASVLAVIIGGGSNLSAVRVIAGAQAAGDYQAIKGFFYASCAVLVVTSVFLALAFALSVDLQIGNQLIPVSGRAGLFILFVWTIGFATQTFFAECLRGFNNIWGASLWSGAGASVATLCILYFMSWYNVVSLFTVFVTVSVVLVCMGALAGAVVGKRLATIKVAPRYEWKKLASLSFPFWITNLALVVLQQADIWIVHVYEQSSGVAIYGAAARLTQLLVFPLLVANSVLLPLITARHATGEMGSLSLILRVSSVFVGGGTLLILVIFISVGPSMLGLLLGGYYTMAWWIFIVLACGHVFNAFFGSAAYVLMMTGRQTEALLITLVAGVVMVVGGWVLGSIYGGLGVAVASAVGLTAQGAIMTARVRYHLGVSLLPRWSDVCRLRHWRTL